VLLDAVISLLEPISHGRKHGYIMKKEKKKFFFPIKERKRKKRKALESFIFS
jgi:hypothetical protein